MPEASHSNATFYHYKLIKKIPVSRIFLRIYLILPYIAIILEMIAISWTSLFYFVLAAPIILWIHYVIARSVLMMSGTPYRKRWRFSMKLPWLGYTTDQHISYRMFNNVYLSIFWIGIAVYAILLFLTPLAFVVSLVFWHLWLLLPQTYVMMRLSKQRKDGMIKLNPQDLSYYQQ